MKETFNHIPTRYLFTVWTMILTFGVVMALYGLQNNANNDTQRSIDADKTLALAFCHSLSDNNQAIKDILSLLSVDSKVTSDMTPSQKESIRVANERRKGYRLISEDLFPTPVCTDGYVATSRQEELAPILAEAARVTTTTTATTTTTTPR